MLQAFTRNYADNSTDAGFQFTFFCDVCNDGVRSSFLESSTYKKKNARRLLGQGIGLAGGLLGGRVSDLAWRAERGADVLNERFQGQSPEWQKEHDQAFEMAQNEARPHFHRCPGCNRYACDQCWNEDLGLCVDDGQRQEVAVAKAHANAMQRNIRDAGETATVWQGNIESKTTMCNSCGKPAGSGKFCNNCGASMDLRECLQCGAKNAQSVRFCNNCGNNLEQQQPTASGFCSGCGEELVPGAKFCGNCGTPS